MFVGERFVYFSHQKSDLRYYLSRKMSRVQSIRCSEKDYLVSWLIFKGSHGNGYRLSDTNGQIKGKIKNEAGEKKKKSRDCSFECRFQPRL